LDLRGEKGDRPSHHRSQNQPRDQQEISSRQPRPDFVFFRTEDDANEPGAILCRIAEQQLARSRGRIVVDLRTVDFMDTTGIRVLLSQKARLEARRGHLRLLIGTDLIRRLLELSGVIDMFEIDESLHPSAQSEHQLHSGLKAV
jgi:anti-anti-sigma factor